MEILGMDSNSFYALVLLILLTILGLVSFHYYAYFSAKNGIRAGTGFGVSILPGRQEMQ